MELCVEASGSIAHLLATDTVNAVLPLRWSSVRRAAGRPGPRAARPVDIDRRIGAALDRLPFALVQVLWLIDVCRCSYDTAAAELGIAPAEVRLRVAEARRTLRAELAATEPTRSDLARAATPTPAPADDLTVRRRGSGGSTNPSRPGWRRPGR